MFSEVASMVKKTVLLAAILLIAALNFGFTHSFDEQDWLSWANKCLSQSYNSSGDPKLKKVELSVTAEYFVRLRKTYAKGKQEYYSFNLHKLNDMDYFGNTNTGILQFKTAADDIIVQTYNDRHGDVDSMTTVLDVPVKNMGPERLDSLRQALNYFKAKAL